MNLKEEMDPSSERLRALPVQLMSTESGIILTRGATTICISGERAKEVVPSLFATASGAGASRRDLIEQFAAPDREMVAKLVDDLLARFLLVRVGNELFVDRAESSLDVFYWHFGQTAATTASNLNEKTISIMGVNTISRQIAQALRSLGMERVNVVDFHILRNVRFFDSNGLLCPDQWPLEAPIAYDPWAEGLTTEDATCIVAASDFGGPYLMREWNEYCVQNGAHFLPVVLDGFTGTIGPLVVPGETACYECFRLRENANMDTPEMERVAENCAPERQGVAVFHPALANILGELAAMELCKMYGGGIPFRSNRIIEVNVLGPAILSRRVLKLPLCPVCSPAVKTSAVYLEKESFVPGNQLNFHEFR